MERFRLLPNGLKEIVTKPLTDEDMRLIEKQRTEPMLRSQLANLDLSIKDLRSELYRPDGRIRPDIEDQLNSAIDHRQRVYEELTGEKFNGEKCFVENSEENEINIEDAKLDNYTCFNDASEEKKQVIRKYIQQLIDKHKSSLHRYKADEDKIRAVYQLVRGSKDYELLGRENLRLLFNNITWGGITAKFDRYDTGKRRKSIPSSPTLCTSTSALPKK